jgi:hypothetical protein
MLLCVWYILWFDWDIKPKSTHVKRYMIINRIRKFQINTCKKQIANATTLLHTKVKFVLKFHVR